MRNTNFLVAALLLAGIALFAGCDKDDKDINPKNDTDPPKSATDSVGDGKSRVKSMIINNSGNTYTYSFAYDASGYLRSIRPEEDDGYEEYSWGQNNVQYEFRYHNFDKAGNFVRNPEGYIISGTLTESVTDRMFGGGTNSTTTNFNCIYDENNQLVTVNMDATNTYGRSGDGQVNYVWENGNLVSIENSGWLPESPEVRVTAYFEYYTDKPEIRDIGVKYFPFTGYEEANLGHNVGGTPAHRYSITLSQLPFLSKNLLKKVTRNYGSTESTEEFTYDFDSKGRVVREIAVRKVSGFPENPEYGRTYEYFD